MNTLTRLLLPGPRAAARERAAVVTWLRRQADLAGSGREPDHLAEVETMPDHAAAVYAGAATLIEKGRHLPTAAMSALPAAVREVAKGRW